MALLVSFTLRREPAVFGDVKTGPSFFMVSVVGPVQLRKYPRNVCLNAWETVVR